MPLQLATFEYKKNKNPDKPPVFENLPGRPDRGQKEDVSGETRTYGNPTRR